MLSKEFITNILIAQGKSFPLMTLEPASKVNAYRKTQVMEEKIEILLKFYEWVIGVQLISRSGCAEEDVVEVFHYYDFHLPSSFLM